MVLLHLQFGGGRGFFVHLGSWACVAVSAGTLEMEFSTQGFIGSIELGVICDYLDQLLEFLTVQYQLLVEPFVAPRMVEIVPDFLQVDSLVMLVVGAFRMQGPRRRVRWCGWFIA